MILRDLDMLQSRLRDRALGNISDLFAAFRLFLNRFGRNKRFGEILLVEHLFPTLPLGGIGRLS
jgi:hypothetical protein